MLRRLLIAIAAVITLTLLGSAMSPSVTGALELKGNQKKQRLLLPAVQKVKHIPSRSTQAKRGVFTGSKTITIGGSRTENQ